MIETLRRSFISITRPHYLYRPQQVLRRFYRQFLASSEEAPVVTLPWGTKIKVNISENIGRSIYLHGIYEIVVSEVLWRLLRPGDIAFDVGAHIGYMTSLMAARVGAAGCVLAFEPHPELFEELEHNIGYIERANGGFSVEPFNLALSRKPGRATLVCPEGFASNRGLASLTTASSADGFSVPTETLDRYIGSSGRVDLVKLDVEGHELSVLQGARHALRGHRMKHVVYECHDGVSSPIHPYLTDFGYAVLALGWRRFGLKISEYPKTPDWRPNDTPCFLATLDKPVVRKALSRTGWRVLHG